MDYVKSLKGCENLVDHLSVESKDSVSTVHDKKVMFDEHLSLYDIKMGIKSNRYLSCPFLCCVVKYANIANSICKGHIEFQCNFADFVDSVYERGMFLASERNVPKQCP